MADKREILLDMLARDKSGPATRSFAKNLKDSGDAAERAGKSADKFGKSTETAAKGADRLADQADDAAGSISKLDREIGLATAELDSLARSFARTDNAAERLDISKAIRRAQNDIRRLTNSKNLIKIPVEPEVDSKRFVTRMMSGIGSAGGSIAGIAGKSLGPTVGIAVGAAAAPVLAATMGTALSSGAGLGVIGAGIALAVKKDPAIQSAGKDVGKRFVDALSTSATANFGGPIRDSLALVSDAADRSAGKISKVFEALGPSVVPFTRDIIAAGERLVDSFTGIAAKSGPALRGLGGSLRLLADGAGDFLDQVADGGPEAAANLQLIAGASADVMRQSGLMLGALNDLSDHPLIAGPVLQMLRQHYADAAAETGTFTRHTKGAADALEGAQRAADGHRNALDELSAALLAQTDPVFGLLNAQDKLKAAQDNVAKATKEHGGKSREAKAALRELAEAALELQGKAGALGDTFKGEVTPELRATLRAAGLTDDQINGLAQQFRGARREGDRFAREYAARVKATNVAATRRQLYSVLDITREIPRTIDIAMRVTRVGNVSKAAAAVRKQYDARATGGPITKDTPYWVGENGPELVFPNHDGRVLSAAASRASARAVGPPQGAFTGSGGGGPARLELVGEAPVVAFVRSLIRKHNLLQVG